MDMQYYLLQLENMLNEWSAALVPSRLQQT